MNDDDGAPNTPEDEAVTVVLAAIDTSSLASRVVEFAARMARRTWENAQLHLLHVYRSSGYDRPSSVGLRMAELVAEAQSYLEHHVRMARRQCPAPVIGHFAEGSPAKLIVERARSLHADLLVVGTLDTVGVEKFLLGSVAEKVAQRAPCSVVIVRQKIRPYTKLTGPVE
jgi:nucleotide-binding universal stress UspA family protein